MTAAVERNMTPRSKTLLTLGDIWESNKIARIVDSKNFFTKSMELCIEIKCLTPILKNQALVFIKHKSFQFDPRCNEYLTASNANVTKLNTNIYTYGRILDPFFTDRNWVTQEIAFFSFVQVVLILFLILHKFRLKIINNTSAEYLE